MDYIQTLTLSLTLSTVCLHAEYQEHPSSAGPPTGEWVLTDTAEGRKLGTEQRIREKKEMKHSAGHTACVCACVYMWFTL